MKKIPILLSTLTLATGMTSLTGVLLEDYSAMALDTGVVSSAESKDLLVYNDPYAIWRYFRLEEVDYKKNRIVYSVGTPAELGNVQAKRVIIAFRNYDKGYSVEDAAAALPTLGVGDVSWYRTLIDTTEPGGLTYAALKKYNLSDDLSDMIYFAVQYGREEMDANGQKYLADETWVRGTIDYRKCVHSKDFDPEQMTCAVNVDLKSQTATVAMMKDNEYTALNPDETVISWEEEWKQELQRRMSELNINLSHIKTQLPIVKTTIADAGITIDDMATSISKLQTGKDLEPSVAKLKTLLAQVQAAYDWMIGPMQQENMNALQAELNTVRAELEALKQGTTDASEELAKVQQALQEMTTKWEQTQEKLGLTETELREKQGELQETTKEITRLQQELQDLQEKLGQKEAELANSNTNNQILQGEIGVIKTEIVQVMAEKDELLQKIEAIKAKYAGFDNEKQGLEMQNTELKRENVALDKEKQRFEEQNTTLVKENQLLKEQNTTITNENETLKSDKLELEARIRQLELELAEKSTCTVVGEVRIGDKPLNEATNESVVENTETEVVENDSGSTTELEVPNLGELETKNNYWWMVAVILGVVGVLGVCCKRFLGHKR